MARFGTAGEFEGLLAVGCVDGSVRVFSQESTLEKWVQRVSLTDARGSVRDLAFAPSATSGTLKLASISADDVLRVYECPQPTSEPSSGNASLTTAGSSAISDPASLASAGLAHWTLQHAIELTPLPWKPCTANSTANLSGFSLNSTSSGFSLSNTARSHSTSSQQQQKHKSHESNGAWSLSWCKEIWHGECLAVSSGETGIIRVSDSGREPRFVN